MKTIFKPFALAGIPEGQTQAPHASNGQAMPGNCSDKTSSKKMKTVPKWLSTPLMLLLALCMTTYSKAQTYNYINLTGGATNVYDHNTPISITTGADDNAFFGNNVGINISTGTWNTMFGDNNGINITSGGYNTIIGGNTGVGATGSYGTYLGYNSGMNDGGTYNTTIGYNAQLNSSALSDASAIGANSLVSNSDEMVFGDNAVTWGFGMDVVSGNVMQVNISGSTAYMDAGGNWHNISDRNLKENFQELDENLILQKVMNLPITQWNYRKDPNKRPHIGPMAQDFYAAFHLDNDSTHISEAAPGDIALVAVKALGKQNVDLENRVKSLTSQNQVLQGTITGLQTQNAQLQSSMSDLQDKFNTVIAEIETLKTLQAQCCGSVGTNNTTGSNTPASGNNNTDNGSDGQPSLAQNAPNPFTQNTVINYYLPASMQNAVITIRTLTGIAIKSFNITNPGSGQVTVTAGTLSPGTYEYDMIANDQIVGSKKMVINGQ